MNFTKANKIDPFFLLWGKVAVESEKEEGNSGGGVTEATNLFYQSLLGENTGLVVSRLPKTDLVAAQLAAEPDCGRIFLQHFRHDAMVFRPGTKLTARSRELWRLRADPGGKKVFLYGKFR